jgi:peptidylprolyl isomerase
MYLRKTVTLCASLALFIGCGQGGGGAAKFPDAAAPGESNIVAGDIPAPSDVAAPPADAQKTPSGLASKVLVVGTGTISPQRQDQVKVHYTGWTTDGKMFDSSVKRGSPATFGLSAVIKGWTEGLALMKVGEKRRFWIPTELAYNNAPGKPAGMLVFDVELFEIKFGPKPIAPPADVAAPPADAKKTPAGVSYKVIRPGTGKKKPGPTDIVTVHYTGWTSDGNMFDSSVVRKKTIEFPLDKVIKGWSEGVQTMVEGEQTRLWIPEELAYQGRPGAPPGMLVFDIELVSMKEGPKPIAAPKDVAAPPKNAKKTKSGLAYTVLRKGKGKEKPTASSNVQVHYTGWTTDGKMFDSSVQRGSPTEFPVGAVIPGWTEGLQLMVAGDKFLFWIPQDLAYKGQEGPPKGMLVFEVELLQILSPTGGPGGHEGHPH